VGQSYNRREVWFRYGLCYESTVRYKVPLRLCLSGGGTTTTTIAAGKAAPVSFRFGAGVPVGAVMPFRAQVPALSLMFQAPPALGPPETSESSLELYVWIICSA